MVTEALAICRAIHERYHPAKRNPWNEIECGDHYARAMASWGVLISLAGFEYHGPAGWIGFAPRLTPDDFRCAFTAAEGWGSFRQRRTGGDQRCELRLVRGRARLTELRLTLASGARLAGARVLLDGAALGANAVQEGSVVRVTLVSAIVMQTGQTLAVLLSTNG
jgi:hypothetical protein